MGSVDGHCDACIAYEQALMDASADGQDPPDVAPCDDYAMSPAFSAWLVAAMRKEVMGQVQMTGLDRMAMLKLDPPKDADSSSEEE